LRTSSLLPETNPLKIKEISSGQNPFFKKLLRLNGSRGIKKFGLALLSGGRNVKEVLEYFPDRCTGLVTYSMDLLKFIVPRRLHHPVYLLPRKLFNLLDFHGTGKPIAILKVGPFRQWDESLHRRGCVLFLPFQDPANVGAAIRSAAAFGVKRVVLLEEAAHPFHPKCLRAAGSTIFHTELMTGPSLSNFFTLSLPLLVLSPRGRDVSTYQFPEAFGLLAGLEGPGVPEGLNWTESLAIPMEKNIDSLNAGMAVGIALYQWRSSIADGRAKGEEECRERGQFEAYR